MPRTVFDVPALKARQQDLEQLASQPGFWDDQRMAQKVLREADGLRTEERGTKQPTNQASEPTRHCPEATCTPPAGAEGPVLDGITQKGISQSFHRCIGKRLFAGQLARAGGPRPPG